MTLIPIRKHEGSFHRSCYFTQWPRLRCFRLIQWSSLSQQHVMRQLSVVSSGENAEFMQIVDTWQRPWGTWAHRARSPACKPSHRHIDTCLMTAGFASSDATSLLDGCQCAASHDDRATKASFGHRTFCSFSLQIVEILKARMLLDLRARSSENWGSGSCMGKKMADLIW